MQNYIMHPSNMRNQDFLLEMRVEEGARGYGIYIMILELMRDAELYRIKNNAKLIAFAINEKDVECVQRIINNYNLFDVSDDGFISSAWLKQTLTELDKKTKALSEAGKRGARARYAKKDQPEQAETLDADQPQAAYGGGYNQAKASPSQGDSINHINNIDKPINQSIPKGVMCDSGEWLSVDVLDAICRGRDDNSIKKYSRPADASDGVERNRGVIARISDYYDLSHYETVFLNAVTDFGRVGGKNLMEILKIEQKMRQDNFKPKFFGNYILKKLLE